MMNTLFEVLRLNGTLASDQTKIIFMGTPLSRKSDGTLKSAVAGEVVIGLSVDNYNENSNMVKGGEFFEGSGDIAYIAQGRVALSPDSAWDYAVDISPTSGSTYVYDATKTYNVNDKLYVDSNGKITNVAGTAGKDFIGVVVKAPGNDGIMIVDVNTTLNA